MRKVETVSFVELQHCVKHFLLQLLLICFIGRSCHFIYLLVDQNSYFQNVRVRITKPVLKGLQIQHSLTSLLEVVRLKVQISKKG
jgi:hypothetical protein